MKQETLIEIFIGIGVISTVALALVGIIAMIAPVVPVVESGIQPCPMCDLTGFGRYVPGLVILVGMIFILGTITYCLKHHTDDKISGEKE